MDEWAYARPYRTNGQRMQSLRRSVEFYNLRRPQPALQGMVPSAVVNKVPEHHK